MIFKHDDGEATVSREEVLAMVNVGEEEGVIEKDENKIISNVMRLDSIKASDVMTPRVVAKTAPETMTLREYYESDEYDHFSRIPVYNEDAPEFITGYVLRDDALEDLAEDHFQVTLGSIKRSLPSFDENKSLAEIFDAMLKQKSQIALVIDEYGCFQGILTLEDIIETIFGMEIIDESDDIIDMQQYARERWQQRQNNHNNFAAAIPYELEQQRTETKEFLDDLMTRDQRMMFAVVTLVHTADSLEQLDSDTEMLTAIGNENLCQFSPLRYQQEDGLNTVLPYGLRRIKALRTLTTESTAVLIPFKAQEIQDLYYQP